MILHGAEGHSLELTILGYQFPSGVSDHHDLNWLRVAVRLRAPDGVFSGEADPCLLTWELRDLVSWLRQLGRDGPAERELDFMEPELSFRVLELQATTVFVQVRARYALVRGSVRGVKPFSEEVQVDLLVSHSELRAAASQLEEEAHRFPLRQREQVLHPSAGRREKRGI